MATEPDGEPEAVAEAAPEAAPLAGGGSVAAAAGAPVEDVALGGATGTPYPPSEHAQATLAAPNPTIATTIMENHIRRTGLLIGLALLARSLNELWRLKGNIYLHRTPRRDATICSQRMQTRAGQVRGRRR